MYEETKSSIDWKGLFLKVIIAFLVVLIGFKAYSTLNSNNKNITKTTETVANSKTSSTFTSNIEKLKKSGESYFAKNKDKLPSEEGNTSMVTLNELINKGEIEKLSDEDGKNCDGESSYVTAIKEGEKIKIKANLVCGSASSYSLVYMGENDNKVEETKTISKSNGTSYSKTTTNTKTSSSNTSCGTSCSTPSVTVSTNTKVNSTVNINGAKAASQPKSNTKTYSSKDYNYTTDTVTVSFDSNDGDKIYASQKVKIGNTAYNPGSTSKYGYTFKGWYLDNKKYDFSTPVNRNITLVAKFTKNSYNDYYDYDYDYDYDYPKTDTTTVYTMGWDSYDKYQVSVSHKLALPNLDESYRQIRIKKISYVKAINTTSLANTYANRHSSTFLYSANGWESNNNNSSSFATVSNAVFSFDSNYKDVYTASIEGFNVTWTSTNISKRCTPFTVYGPTGTAENVCNYGIVYKVTWEYIR